MLRLLALNIISLFGRVYGDGLALRVIKAVHRLDVHYHGQAKRHDEHQDEGDKDARPDRGRHEANTIIRGPKFCVLIRRFLERLNL